MPRGFKAEQRIARWSVVKKKNLKKNLRPPILCLCVDEEWQSVFPSPGLEQELLSVLQSEQFNRMSSCNWGTQGTAHG